MNSFMVRTVYADGKIEEKEIEREPDAMNYARKMSNGKRVMTSVVTIGKIERWHYKNGMLDFP